MSEHTTAETRSFQAEAKQLLHLMTHSLYSNREIFLRELVSNAADACDKLRFEALDDDSLYEGNSDLRVRIETDSKKRKVIIEDNGIGMNRDEVIENLGTIAHSGTARFFDKLTGDNKKDAALIGQFGVGFYSAFIVADRVDVFTRRAGEADDQGVHWSCDGEAEYTVEPWQASGRGTRIELQLKKDAREFADDWRLRTLVKKYSDHIPVAVQMRAPARDDVDDSNAEQSQFEAINSVRALWTRSRSEISEDEYREFYHYLTHDPEDPISWSHNRIEGKLDYTSLIYIPSRAPFDLWQRETPRGLKLYIKRTFVLDEADQFLPLYLRFVRGVIDSDSLPMNVSRELLQNSPAVEKIRGAVTKRVLDMLQKLANKQPDDYQKLWDEFGQVLKEGPVEDAGNREKIAGLLRFASTANEDATQSRSLADYVAAMPEGQQKIYYLAGESYSSVARSPLLETFRKQGVEVLLLSDRIDEWTMAHLQEFDGKPLQDIARGELPDLGGESPKDEADETDKAETRDALLQRLREHFAGRAETVRFSRRLVESPACLVVAEHDLGMQMRKIMEAAGQQLPDSLPVLEINREHPLVVKLEAAADAQRFGDLADTLFDQASLAVGRQLDDPAGYVERINRLLLELA